MRGLATTITSRCPSGATCCVASAPCAARARTARAVRGGRGGAGVPGRRARGDEAQGRDATSWSGRNASASRGSPSSTAFRSFRSRRWASTTCSRSSLDADDILRSPLGELLRALGVTEQAWFRHGEIVPPIARGTGPAGLPRLERQYFLFGQPIDTKRFAGRHDDREGCLALREGGASAPSSGRSRSCARCSPPTPSATRCSACCAASPRQLGRGAAPRTPGGSPARLGPVRPARRRRRSAGRAGG